MSPLLRAATAAVRGWTAFYTWRLPTALRDARRAEIASDVWEFANDPVRPPDRSAALHMLARLLLGVPDDLSWRAAYTPARLRNGMSVALAIGVSAFVVATVWLFEQVRAHDLPQPPAMMKFVAAPPPPPLPVPPPAPSPPRP